MIDLELIKLLQELTSFSEELTWLEFKKNKGSISNDEIGEYISAISNSTTIARKSYGYLVWGIENETQKWVGTNFYFSKSKQGNQNLELWLRNLLKPKINFEAFEFDFRNDHYVLIRIPAAIGEPTNFKNIPYIRIGSHKTDLRNYPPLLKQIYNSAEDWSSKIIEQANINNLDSSAITIARQKFTEKHKSADFEKEIEFWDDLTFLNKAKITIDGQITRTALLLFRKRRKFTFPYASTCSNNLEVRSRRESLSAFQYSIFTFIN